MNFISTLLNVNIFAILLASIAYLLLLGIWYSPHLFGNYWVRNCPVEEETPVYMPAWLSSLLSFLSAFVASFVMSMLLGVHPSPVFGALAGGTIALVWIATSRFRAVIYDHQPVGLFLIHAGFDLVAYVMMGAIVGYWR